MSAPYPNILPFYLHSATSAGAGGGDEDPHRNPYRLKSSHEADVPDDQNPYQEETKNDQSAQQAKRIKRKSPQKPCPICLKSFLSTEALHGHIRFHHGWAWRAIVPPEKCDPHIRGRQMGAGSASAAEASGGGGGIEWRFKCHNCGAKFRTGQGLGGHKRGCNRLARDRLFVEQLLGGASVNNDNNSRDGSAQGSRLLDLNLPPPEEEEEEDE